MKKLTTLFILLFVSFNLFAAPKIPKLDNYTSDITKRVDFNTNEMLSYIDDSGQNLYKLYAISKENEYSFHFINKSYITFIEIEIIIHFKSEQALDTYLQKFNTMDIEKEFKDTRRILSQFNLTPIVSYDKDTAKPKTVLYIVNL